MPIAYGVGKSLRYKKESTLNTAPGASSAQLLRRVTSEFSLAKQAYQSDEIRTDYQVQDFRHGSRQVNGALNGELSCLTFADFFAAATGAAWATATTSTALTNVTAAASSPHFVRAAGSWLTDGFKVGDIVRWTGWTTGGVANNSRNYRITVLTATNMTVTDLNSNTATVAAKASGDSVTCVLAGKKNQIPQSGHTRDTFYFEEWHSDIAQSERFGGCGLSSIALNLPATGLATVNFNFLGVDISTATSAYYTSPTAATTSGIMAAVNGKLRVGGTDIATVTSLSMNFDTGLTNAQVVGSNITPDLFPGRKVITGSFSAYFEDAVLRDNFIDEDEISLFTHLTATNANASPVMGLYLPRVKLGQSQKTDGMQGIMRNYTFQALLNSAGGAGTNSDQSTFVIQDSEVP